MVLTQPRRMIIVLVSAFWIGACGDQPNRVSTTQVDTLASGQIVIHNAVNASSAAAIRLEPIIRIGTALGGGPASFGRIADVLIGPDSNVYVLDGQAAEIRVFDLEGNHVRTVGRPGDGPGEFRLPYAMAFDPSRRLWVVDERHRRYTVFDSAGNVVTTILRPIRWPVTTGEMRLSTADLVHEHGWWDSGPGGAIQIRVNGDAQVEDTIPIPPFGRPFFSSRDRPEGGMPIPFAPRQAADVGPSGRVWTGYGDAYRLAELTGDGDTIRLVQLDVEPAALSEADQAAARDSVTAAIARGLDADESRIPAAHPYFADVIIAANSDLWVRRLASETPLGSPSPNGFVFDVFTGTGEYLGSAPAPDAGFPAPDIRDGYLAGVVRDELGVDYIQVYAIVR